MLWATGNLLALASRIADPYYIGFSTAAAHYGLTTQHRNVIYVVTPVRLRGQRIGEAQVQIVNPSATKFFGFEPVDVLGYKVMISDREKTDNRLYRPSLAGRRRGRSRQHTGHGQPQVGLDQSSRLS